MGTKHRTSKEVKADVLKRIKEGTVTVQQAADEHGLTESAIYRWLQKGVAGAPSWSEFSKVKRENEELFRVIGELTLKLSTT
jgi:transposase-like protein